jgi:DNA-binding Lrp family transcriptional regulator
LRDKSDIAQSAQKLSAALEEGLPILPEPFADIADFLGMDQDSAVRLTEELIRTGYLRHFGVFWNMPPSYGAYLFGAAVTPEKLEGTVAWINGMRAVTHNYQRKHDLNLWFTAIFRREASALRLCQDLRQDGTPYAALETVRRIRLRPSFAGISARESAVRIADAPLGDIQKNIIALLECGLKPQKRLFAGIAPLVGLSEREFLYNLAELKRLGHLRRVGASVNHYAAGYLSNSLVACDFTDTPDEDAVLRAEKAIMERDWASHCYLRHVVSSNLAEPWRFNLFIMIHARDDSELAERERLLAESLAPGAPERIISMRTSREYKKTRGVYYGEGNEEKGQVSSG